MINPLNLFTGRARFMAEAVLVALAAGAIAWALLAFAKHHRAIGDAAGYARGHAEAVALQKLWDDEKLALQHAALVEAERRRQQDADTHRKQQEALNAQAQQAVQLAADRDRARSALDGLQHRTRAYIAAVTVGDPGPDDSAAAQRRAAAEALGDAFGSCSRAYEELAAQATSYYSAGQLCERYYDALMVEANAPP